MAAREIDDALHVGVALWATVAAVWHNRGVDGACTSKVCGWLQPVCAQGDKA